MYPIVKIYITGYNNGKRIVRKNRNEPTILSISDRWKNDYTVFISIRR
jgi:hypothetical protein